MDVDGPKGHDLWQRADRVLPGGSVYLTRSADMAGRGLLPGFITSANGCRVTDVDGREYIDYQGANGPNLLGYRHPEVEAAARAQADNMTSASFLSPSLVEVVETLLSASPGFDWGMVAKTGSEVVSLGVRFARALTGRRDIVTFQRAYHGSDPELALRPPAGALEQVVAHVHRIPWNEAGALMDFCEAHGDTVAAIVLNPLDQNPGRPTATADADFLTAINTVREKFGIQLVFDDVRHGFRMHPEGSHRALGIDPDIACLGKALGNGYAISGLLAKEHLREAARKILYTSTYVFETPPMQAAITTLTVYRRDDAFGHMVAMGERLRDGITACADAAGLDISYTGPVTMPTLLFNNDKGLTRLKQFAGLAAEGGVILHPMANWMLSAAHGPADIDETISVASAAMAKVAAA